MGAALSMLVGAAPLSDRPSGSDTRAENQHLTTPFLVIFGSANRPWNVENWQEVSDTVRGGRSQATLKYINPSAPSDGVSFEGNLDSQTLGGAGFASQVYRHPLSLPDMENESHRYSAFILELDPLQQDQHWLRTFTFGVRDAPLGPPNESAVIYQYDFTLSSLQKSNLSKLDQLVKIKIPFNRLVPTFRGRPKPDEKPFNPTQTSPITFMARSFFNHQSGPFHLNIRRLAIE